MEIKLQDKFLKKPPQRSQNLEKTSYQSDDKKFENIGID